MSKIEIYSMQSYYCRNFMLDCEILFDLSLHVFHFHYSYCKKIFSSLSKCFQDGGRINVQRVHPVINSVPLFALLASFQIAFNGWTCRLITIGWKEVKNMSEVGTMTFIALRNDDERALCDRDMLGFRARIDAFRIFVS